MGVFLANEVVAQVEGLNTVKTLNRWRKVVEEHFGINYFRHSFINDYPSMISYSADNVKRFQLTALILSGQPSNRKNLQQAVLTAFSPEESFVKKKTEIELLEDTFQCQVADLANEDKRLLTAIQGINYRLAMIEKQLQADKDGKLKLFRRK